MNRIDLQQLSEIRIEEKILLDNSFYDGAYYLCGYSIECALKACIAKNINQYDFPDKKLIVDSYTHEVAKLLRLAGLVFNLEKDTKSNSLLGLNWTIIKDWSETARYRRNTTETAATDLYNSIIDPTNGIMQWIQTHWYY